MRYLSKAVTSSNDQKHLNKVNLSYIPRKTDGPHPGAGTDGTKHRIKKGSGSAEGFLLLNSSFHPIFVNRAAAEILSYPQKVESTRSFEEYLTSRVQGLLVSRNSTHRQTVAHEIQSGSRMYRCRAYRVNSLGEGDPQGSLAVILERISNRSGSLVQAYEKFALTNREREVLRFLVTGLTTKQIATGMDVSPNTVKAFLRMIMVKMGVSTRSGVVGKALAGME